MDKVKFRHISFLILGLLLLIVAVLAWKLYTSKHPQAFELDREFFLFCLVGFFAQAIDGSLGMGYGVSCSTFLLHMGVPPAFVSASVHTASVFTTGTSGLSHLYFKNVDKQLFIRLAIPGAIGATIGAFLISEVLNAAVIKPIIASYLLILGFVILRKSLRGTKFKEEVKNVSPLGFVGGMLATVGGGGWGPIVASNLINKGKTPQLTIGTVNTAEFFVSFCGAGVFLFFLGLEEWKTILGLIIGGVLAAPLGAYLVRFIRPKVLMFLVGFVIVLISAFTIYKSLA